MFTSFQNSSGIRHKSMFPPNNAHSLTSGQSASTPLEPSAVQYAGYPLSTICVIVVLLKNRKPYSEARIL